MVLLTLLACFPELPDRPSTPSDDSAVEGDTDTDTDADTDSDTDADTDTDTDTDVVIDPLGDEDGDGWRPFDGDCDDRADSVHPLAADPAGDDADQDCDGYAEIWEEAFLGGTAGTEVLGTGVWSCIDTGCGATYSANQSWLGDQSMLLAGNGDDIGSVLGILDEHTALTWRFYDTGSGTKTGLHLLNTASEVNHAVGACATDYCVVTDGIETALAPRTPGWHRAWWFVHYSDGSNGTMNVCIDQFCSPEWTFEDETFNRMRFFDEGVGAHIDDVSWSPLYAVDHDADGSASWQDCWDGDSDINPQSPEICDGYDNDCDGAIDEGDICSSTVRGDVVPQSALEIDKNAAGYVQVDAHVGDFAWCPGEDLTLEMWVKVAMDGDGWRELLWQGDNTPQLALRTCSGSCGPVLQFLVFEDEQGAEANYNGDPFTGEWQLLMAHIDPSGSLRIGIDGRWLTTNNQGSLSGCVATSDSLTIGGDQAMKSHSGQYGWLRISAVDRYPSTISGIPNQLRWDRWTLGAWNLALDEGEVLERSGNAGNGTLYGSGTRVEVSF